MSASRIQHPIQHPVTIGILIAVFSLVTPVVAQTPTIPTDKIGWDQAAPDLATATAYQYAMYVDAGPRLVLLGTTCIGTLSSFVCTASLPAMTPGNHSLMMTAAELVNGTPIESAKSAAFLIRVVVAPVAPQTLRIVR